MKNVYTIILSLFTAFAALAQPNSKGKFYINLSNKNFNSNLTVDKNESIQRYVKGTENAFFNYENDKVTIVIFEDNTNGINSLDESKLILSKSSQTISFQSNTLIFEDSDYSNLKMIPRGSYALSKGTYQAALQSKNVFSTTINLKNVAYNRQMPFYYQCAATKIADIFIPNDFILLPQFSLPSDNTQKINTPDGVKMEVIGNVPYLSSDGKLDLSLMPSQEPTEKFISILYRFAGSDKIHELKIKHFRVNDSDELPYKICREFGITAQKSVQNTPTPQEGMGGIILGGGEGVVVASKPKSGPKNPGPDNGGAKDPSKPANKN
jgi:hypothetical protein